MCPACNKPQSSNTAVKLTGSLHLSRVPGDSLHPNTKLTFKCSSGWSRSGRVPFEVRTETPVAVTGCDSLK